MGFLTQSELGNLGLRYVGRNVKISSKASLYGINLIEIDDYSRIDDFCILSAGKGGIKIGKYVHIACYSSLIGQGRIFLNDFSGISSRVSIYSSTADYSGNHLTNPTIPETYSPSISGEVFLDRHVVVGVGSIILPNVSIGEGTAVGALSLVTKNLEPFGIYGGIPARYIKERSTNLLKIETKFISTKSKN